jgi:hypothetical protein
VPALDAADPRWELTELDPLGATRWYRAQPGEARARIGLRRNAAMLRRGLLLHEATYRGLCSLARTRSPQVPEQQALTRVLAAEGQCASRRKFVERSGLAARESCPRILRTSRQVAELGDTAPELLLVFVLGGLDPLDHMRRRLLRRDRPLHRLLEDLARGHVAEVARKARYAYNALRARTTRLNAVERRVLAIQAPVVLGTTARALLMPSQELVEAFDIPANVVARSADFGTLSGGLRSPSRARRLLAELGLVTPGSLPVWRAVGIHCEAA